LDDGCEREEGELMPTLQERKEQTKLILEWHEHEKKERQLEGKAYTQFVYNNALTDVLDAIDVYVEKNRQHQMVLRALQSEIKGWMPLVR